MTFQENRNIPTSHPGHGQGPAGASLSDLLTAVQHVASNIAQLGQTLLSLSGQQMAGGITGAPILVKQGAGRVAKVAVISEVGTGPAAQLVDSINPAATGPVIYSVPGAVGLYEVNLPFSLGLVVIPTAGDVVSVSFS